MYRGSGIVSSNYNGRYLRCRSGDPRKGHLKPRYSFVQEVIDPGEADAAGRYPSDPSGMSRSTRGRLTSTSFRGDWSTMKQLSINSNLGKGEVYEAMHPYVADTIVFLHISNLL